MKSSIIISSYQSSITVLSNDFNLNKLFRHKFLKEYVPAYSNDKFSSDAMLLIKKGKYSIIENKNRFVLSMPELDIIDVVTTVEYLLEKERQLKGIYCMHGSAVIYKSQAIILWGQSTGIGKTTTMLELIRNNGCSYYSDEKILINLKKNEVVGGILCPNLSKFNSDATFGKTINNLNLKRATKSYKISAIFYPILSESENDTCIYEKWPSIKINWHLYEELSRKIRGTSRRVFNIKQPLQSIDNQSIALSRSNDVHSYSKNIGIFYIKGSSKNVGNKIIDIASTKK